LVDDASGGGSRSFVRERILSAVVAVAALGMVASMPVAAADGWRSGGVPVAPSDSIQSDPVIAPDGAGGAFIAWQDYRSGATIYGQHLTAGGVPAPGWPDRGLALSTDGEADPVIIPDGRGGAFVAASTGRSIHAYHLSAAGTITPSLAGAIGVASAEKVQPTVLPMLIPDGDGGAFMAWESGHWLHSNVAVEHIAADGSAVPGWGGEVPNWSDKFSPVLCSDGAGGVIVAWMWLSIRATRFGADSGVPTGWPDTTVAVCQASGRRDALGIVPDGAGGALIVWEDGRNGSYDQVFAQRIDATGVIATGWPADGQAVCRLPSRPGLVRYSPSGLPPARYSAVAPDGAGGALIVWTMVTSDGGDIYAQHVRPDGSLAPGWPIDGLQVCTAPGSQEAPSIAADGAGGAFVCWQDGRSTEGVGVYAQHLNGDRSTAPGWPSDGLPLCAAPFDHQIPRVAIDGAGGAIVAWQDLRCSDAGPAPQVFASHVASDATLPVAPGIIAASATATGSAADSGIVRVSWRTMGAHALPTPIYCRQIDGPWIQVGTRIPDQTGVVTYADADAIAGCRYGYALGLTTCGAERILGETWVDIPNGAGFMPLSATTESVSADSGRVQLIWKLTGGEALTASLFRRDSCSSWIALKSNQVDEDGRVVFEDQGLFEGQQLFYRVRVHACGADQDLQEFRTEIPRGRGFIPIEATLTHQEAGPGGVYLTWRQVSGPPSAARIYRRDSTSAWALRASLNPDGAGVIRYFDSEVIAGARYEYQLGLWSCGAEPTFGPTIVEIPDHGTGPSPRELALHSAAPSPARGEVTVLFTLPGDEPASLEVFDVRGRRLLARQVGGMGPGDHALVLADDTALSPGIYLVRLSQGGRSLSMRVALVY